MIMDDLRELADWHADLRAQFPLIVSNPQVAFLDSAATSQKPQAVIDAIQHYLITGNANVARGSYPWANATTAMVERTRDRVRTFLHDPNPERSGVHFVSGATEGLHRVAFDWLADWLVDGDEILIPHADHQANVVPWLAMRDHLAARGRRIRVVPMPYDPASGDYDHRAFPEVITDRTTCVAATHVHHVYGGNMNIHRIRAAVGPDVPICVDAAQSVGHMPVSATDLDVDFIIFSGHKTLALPGTGVIWARNQRGPVFRPHGWAGTPNTVGILSLGIALDWLDNAGPDRIERWTSALAIRLTHALDSHDDIEVLGCQQSVRRDLDIQRRIGIVTFRNHRIPSDDLGFILAAAGILVRSDTHCQSGHNHTSDRSIRVSTHAYTTVDEIDRLLAVLESLR